MFRFSNFDDIESYIDDCNVIEKYHRVCMVIEENHKRYYHQLLSYWFDGSLTKPMFDQELRKIIKLEDIKYHNEFIMSIVNWLPTMSKNLEENEEVVRNPTKYKYYNEPMERIHMYLKNVLASLPIQQTDPLEIPEFTDHNFEPNSMEEVIHTKFITNIITTAPSCNSINLDVEKEACELISVALKMFLKNLIKRTSDNNYPKISHNSSGFTDFSIDRRKLTWQDILVTLKEYPKIPCIVVLREKLKFLPKNSSYKIINSI